MRGIRLFVQPLPLAGRVRKHPMTTSLSDNLAHIVDAVWCRIRRSWYVKGRVSRPGSYEPLHCRLSAVLSDNEAAVI